MREYLVTWVIDIEADTPVEAAKQAFKLMQNPQSTACVFSVSDKADANRRTEVDLSRLPRRNTYEVCDD